MLTSLCKSWIFSVNSLLVSIWSSILSDWFSNSTTNCKFYNILSFFVPSNSFYFIISKDLFASINFSFICYLYSLLDKIFSFSFWLISYIFSSFDFSILYFNSSIYFCNKIISVSSFLKSLCLKFSIFISSSFVFYIIYVFLFISFNLNTF